MGAKPLHIWFEKINRIIKIFIGIRYLELLCSKKYDIIYNRIRYLTSKKRGTTDNVRHSFARIGIDLLNSLQIKKTPTFHNVITLLSQLFIRMNITTTIICF